MNYRICSYLVALVIGISGCGGSGGSGGTSSQRLAVAPSLGSVTHATAKLYQSDSTTLLGESDTGSSGTINISYNGSYSGPIIVAVIGDSDAQYYDEASGTQIAFGAGKLMRAIVPGGTTQTAVTPLTELAYQLSLANSITLTDTTVNQLNDRVRQAMAPELTSLLTTPIPFDGNTTTGSLDDSEAGKYALRLAALAMLGSSDATPALTVMEQLVRDLSDGTLDGQDASGAISGLVYTPGSFAANLATHLATLAGSFGTAGLQTALAGYSATSTSIDVSGIGGGSGGTLPSGVAGQSVTMEYCCATSGAIYNNGDQVLFTFSSSATLMLTNQSTVVATTFTQRGSEYIWVDSVNAMEYALSLNNGSIHEVTLYGIGGSPFYGQFAPVSSGGAALTPIGDGAALAGGSGATGTVGSTVYTYSGHPVAGSALYAFNPTDSTGLFSAYDGTSAITRWTINGFPATVGTYSCGSGGALPSVSLTQNGTPYQADQCTIEILSASTTEVEGKFAAHLVDAGSNEFGTVTDGYFRYAVPSSGGGLPTGQYGYSMDVDGSNVTQTGVAPLDGFDRPVAGYLSLGDAPTLQLRMIPDGGIGTYACGDNAPYRTIAIWWQGSSYTTDGTHGGDCTIVVTSAGPIYEGTYSGTLHTSSGTTLVITNGVFRNDGSGL